MRLPDADEMIELLLLWWPSMRLSHSVQPCCRFVVAWFLSATLSVTTTYAHPGGVDAAGGHVDKRTGLYHFHRVGGSDGDSIDSATNLPKNATLMPSSNATPEQKRKAAREHVAEALLRSAHQSKRHLEALSAVAEVFPETKAGARAKRAVERLSKEQVSKSGDQPKFSKKQLAEQAAMLRLDVAKQLLALKQNELAIEVLRSVVEEHPKTHAATQVEKLLEKTSSDSDWPPKNVPLPEGGFFDSKSN